MGTWKVGTGVGTGIASHPGVQKGGGNAWYTLFAHALNLLLGNCIMDTSDVDVWAGFCDDVSRATRQ